jgi:two-component system, LytTR family, sensor kinase
MDFPDPDPLALSTAKSEMPVPSDRSSTTAVGHKRPGSEDTALGKTAMEGRTKAGTREDALGSSGAVGVPGILLWFLVWTALGTLSHIRYYVYSTQAGLHRSFWPELAEWLTCFYPWAFLSPLVFLLEKRFPLQRENLAKNLGVLALASVGFAYVGYLAGQLFVAASQLWLGKPYSLNSSAWAIPLSEAGVQQTLYWSTAGASYIVRHFHRLREREREANRLALEKSQLEASLKQAELETLRMRLNPHFLFNTLQNISVLAQQDPRTASQMLTRLGDLLRVAFRRDAQPEVPLEVEIGLTRTYLEVEQMRFGERLSVVVEMAPGTEQALVPTFLLQPLVENAIKHGLRGKASAGRIQIQSAKQNGSLTVSVTDNGAGITPGNLQMGVGLGSTCERLSRMYSECGKLAVRKTQPEGTEVLVTLPLRWSAAGPDKERHERSSIVDCR